MTTFSPIPMASGQPTSTKNGSIYVYSGENAAQAVAAATSLVMATLAQQQKDEIEASLASAGTNDVVIGVLSAVLTVIGTASTVASAVSGATSAGASIAGVITSSSAAQGESVSVMEVTVHNDTIAPLVFYHYSMNSCSIASACRPLLPSTAETIDITENGDFETSSNFQFDFLAGQYYGSDLTPNAPQTTTGTPASVKYDYSTKKWVPSYSIDGSAFLGADSAGLTAASFIPNNDKQLGFTIASYRIQKSLAAIDLLFLPAAVAAS